MYANTWELHTKVCLVIGSNTAYVKNVVSSILWLQGKLIKKKTDKVVGSEDYKPLSSNEENLGGGVREKGAYQNAHHLLSSLCLTYTVGSRAALWVM